MHSSLSIGRVWLSRVLWAAPASWCATECQVLHRFSSQIDEMKWTDIMDGERRQERVLGGNFQPSHNIRGPGIGWRMEVFYIICTMTTNACCAECGEEGSVSLKACKACMLVKYCNSSCQHKHWANHKTACKLRAPNYTMRCSSRTHRPRRPVPFAFYQCL